MTCSPRARHFLKRVTVLKGLSNNPLIRLKRSWSVGSFRMENVPTGLRLIIQNGGGGGAEGGARQDTPAEAAGGTAW